MSLLDKFTKRSNLDPLKRLEDDISRSLERKFENEVENLFSSTLRKAGLSSVISAQLASRFGDALKNELADKYFRTSSAEYNRVSRKEICDNFTPSYADTSSGAVRSVKNKLKDLDGTNKEVLQFPAQLGKYYMSMQFRRYVKQAPQLQTKLEFDNGIVLPLPRRLEDDFSIQVGEASLGTSGAISDFIQNAAAGNKDSNATDTVVFAAATRLLGSLSQETGNALTSYLGSIPNPHVAAIFQGVNLRQHSFEWTFAPRNPEESVALQKIILKLKQNSLPAFSTLGTPVLQYPLMCQIRLQPWYSTKNELITYKPAFLQNVKVNYSPNGIPSFFAGTTLPTFVQLSLQFIETTYFTSNDFGRMGFDDSNLDEFITGVEDFVATASPEAYGFITDIKTSIDDFATSTAEGISK